MIETWPHLYSQIPPAASHHPLPRQTHSQWTPALSRNEQNHPLNPPRGILITRAGVQPQNLPHPPETFIRKSHQSFGLIVPLQRIINPPQ